jgi:hypothetical protein
LLHPVALAAIALLVLNDHVLKEEWGHPATGTVSDFAGLAFFPLVLVSLVELAASLGGKYAGPSRRVLTAAVLATGVVFAAAEVVPAGTEFYRVGLGASQDPAGALQAVIEGRTDEMRRVATTPDATDLFALPALGIAYLIGRPDSRNRPTPG